MAEVLIRDVADDIVERLHRKADASGTSFQDLARRALAEAARPIGAEPVARRPSREELLAEIDRIRAMSVPTNFDSTALIREDRDSDDPYR